MADESPLNGADAVVILHARIAQEENERARYDELQAAILEHETRGSRVRLLIPETPEETVKAVGRAVDQGVPRIIAGGGDGTVHLVANALAEHRDGRHEAIMGALPLGTANDFCKGVELPLTLADALGVALHAEPLPIDLLKVNDAYCVNVASGGFGARATQAASGESKAALGGFAYLYEGLKLLVSDTPERGRVSGPGFEWDGEFRVVALGNSVRAGGGWRVCPNAAIDDGLLDVLILPADPAIATFIGALMASSVDYFLQKMTGAVTEETGVIQYLMDSYPDLFIRTQLAEVRIDTDEPLDLNLDGENLKSTVFDAHVEPARLRFALPSSSLVLRRNLPVAAARSPGDPSPASR